MSAYQDVTCPPTRISYCPPPPQLRPYNCNVSGRVTPCNAGSVCPPVTFVRDQKGTT